MTNASLTTRAEWRPQRFGRFNGRKVADPLVEPIWAGERVLAHIGNSATPVADGQPDVAIVDETGLPIEEFPEVTKALGAAARARSLVIDGYLTDRVEGSSANVAVDVVPIPRVSEFGRQMLLGGGLRRPDLTQLDRSIPVAAGVPTTFVAIDVLLVDDEELLDVPLLERKRVLESVLDENQFVRRGIYVRPPLSSWFLSWKAIGFESIAFKAANSRYQPGRHNDGWAISKIPSR